MSKDSTKLTIKVLPISALRTDGETRPRAEMDELVVSQYAARMNAGDEFPPVEVFCDGESYWLASGFHRLAAAKLANFSEINCRVHPGTLADAQWFSYGANKEFDPVVQ